MYYVFLINVFKKISKFKNKIKWEDNFDITEYWHGDLYIIHCYNIMYTPYNMFLFTVNINVYERIMNYVFNSVSTKKISIFWLEVTFFY